MHSGSQCDIARSCIVTDILVTDKLFAATPIGCGPDQLSPQPAARSTVLAADMDREADAGAPTHAAEGAENLSLATRTLSVQDGELPPPPQAEDRSSSSPFASHSSMPQPDDAAAPEAAAADHTGTAQPSAGAQEDGQKNNQPRAVRSVKRNKLTTERTGSDAADIARQRVSLDAHKGRDSSSGSSAGRKATKAAPPWSSSDSQRFGCGPGSEADGEPPEGRSNSFDYEYISCLSRVATMHTAERAACF